MPNFHKRKYFFFNFVWKSFTFARYYSEIVHFAYICVLFACFFVFFKARTVTHMPSSWVICGSMHCGMQVCQIPGSSLSQHQQGLYTDIKQWLIFHNVTWFLGCPGIQFLSFEWASMKIRKLSPQKKWAWFFWRNNPTFWYLNISGIVRFDFLHSTSWSVHPFIASESDCQCWQGMEENVGSMQTSSG